MWPLRHLATKQLERGARDHGSHDSCDWCSRSLPFWSLSLQPWRWISRAAPSPDTSFGFATVTQTDFGGATLVGTNFNDGTITGSNFAGAAMGGAEMWRTQPTSISLEGTEVHGMVFGETNLTGATGFPIGAETAAFNNATCPDGVVGSTPCWG